MIADLCLVLLLDASGSIDDAEWTLQAKATAEALSTTAIVERITRGPPTHGISSCSWMPTRGARPADSWSAAARAGSV